MSEGADQGGVAVRMKRAEVVVALLFVLLSATVMYDSVRLGMKWAPDGPQPGYFPFYIGVLICVASLVNLARALAVRSEDDPAFVETAQLKLVLTVLLPAAIYVGLIGWLGIYLASALFVGYFMRRLGGYAWWKVVLISIGNSVTFFLIFEVWFKLPLPKGPLERLLGLD